MSSFQSFGVNNSMMNLISGLSSSTLTQMHKDRDARVKEMQEREDKKAEGMSSKAEGMSSMMGNLLNPMMGVLGGQLGKSLFPWGGEESPQTQLLSGRLSRAAEGHFEGMGTGEELQQNMLSMLYPDY